jgi:Fe2+ transport system protein FeoA
MGQVGISDASWQPILDMSKYLSSMPVSSIVVVTDIREGSLSPRLVEMGLCKGCKVEVLYRAPFNGPIAIDLGTSVLSLRLDEADMVLVEEMKG